MGLAQNQDLPIEKRESQGWTARTLISLGGLSKSIAKSFTSPFEWMFTFCLFVIAYAEIMDEHLSWFFYTVGIILLFCVMLRRALSGMNEEDKGTKK